MKKLVVSIIALAVVTLTGTSAAARNVTVAEAAEAAAYYMEHYTMHDGVKATDLTLMHSIEGKVATAAYCFNVSDWGWIIMSGSAAIDPVIGYSDEGNLGEWSTLAPSMRWWVEHVASQISNVQEADAIGKFDDVQEWSDLLNRSLTPGAKDGDPRVYLLTSKWDQGDEHNPTYNLYCPYDSATHRYSITGCVATAMAQIVRYYGYPIAPKGRKYYHTSELDFEIELNFNELRFDYSQMPDRLFNNSSTAQIHNVALLNYACGVAVEMNYTPDGSGSQSVRVINGMKSYMKYTQGTYTERSSSTTDNFINLIRGELLLRRPVYMSGASSTNPSGSDAAGHAWVCCGYRTDNNTMYYMNWGWSGGGDGFFNIYSNSANAMYINGYGYTFNLSQAVITGAVPPSPDSSAVDFMTPIRLVEDNTVLLPAYPNPAVFSVTLPYSVTSDAEMQIMSIDGKLVATRRLQPGSSQVTLDVYGMPAGIYVYRVGGQSGKFIVR